MYQKNICATYSSQMCGERIDKDRIYNEEMGCYRKNKFGQQIQKVISKYEKKSENYLALVCLACCSIVYRRIILG